MDDVRAPATRESIPLALWVIVLLAMSPFPVTALVYGYGPDARMESMIKALLSWSAVVLSFLGGVRWGLETREPAPRPMRQAFSALCAVVGWVILMALDPRRLHRRIPASVAVRPPDRRHAVALSAAVHGGDDHRLRLAGPVP